MILVVVAVEEELRAVRRVFSDSNRINEVPDRYSLNHSVIQLVKTGIGPERARRKVSETLADHPATLVISTGFAAGLDSSRTKGEFVIINRSCTGNSNDSPQNLYDASQELVKLTYTSLTSPVATCSIVSVNHIVWQATEKHYIHQRTNAQVLDMETASVAQASDEAGVPWIGFRVISDTFQQSLPFDMQGFETQGGELDRRAITIHALTHPWTIPGLIRLGFNAVTASKRLTTGLREALTMITTMH